MEKIKKLPLVAMIAMVILSFTNLFGLNIAGVTVIIGVIIFFINKAMEKTPDKDSGLDIKRIGSDLKNKKIWIWILLPLIMDAITIAIGKLYIPGYLDYEIGRSSQFVSFQIGLVSIIQLFVLALGEEIAWRAFFQRQLSKAWALMPVLIFSSTLFALGHFKAGGIIVVAYNLIGVFINSMLYGVVYHKTQNAWISTLSHFAANLFSVIVFAFL